MSEKKKIFTGAFYNLSKSELINNKDHYNNKESLLEYYIYMRIGLTILQKKYLIESWTIEKNIILI